MSGPRPDAIRGVQRGGAEIRPIPNSMTGTTIVLPVACAPFKMLPAQQRYLMRACRGGGKSFTMGEVRSWIEDLHSTAPRPRDAIDFWMDAINREGVVAILRMAPVIRMKNMYSGLKPGDDGADTSGIGDDPDPHERAAYEHESIRNQIRAWISGLRDEAISTPMHGGIEPMCTSADPLAAGGESAGDHADPRGL